MSASSFGQPPSLSAPSARPGADGAVRVPAVSADVLDTPVPAATPAGRPTAADVYRMYAQPNGELIRGALLTREEACLVLRLTHSDGRPNVSRLYQLRNTAGLRAAKRGGTLLFRLGDLLDFCAAEAEEPFQQARRAR